MRAQRDWERSLDRSTPLAWGPARGLVAYYPFDGDLSAPISVSQDGKPTALTFQSDLTVTSAHYGQPADGQPAAEQPATAPVEEQAQREKEAEQARRNKEARFVPGQLGQAASFDGKGFIQAGDIAGFDRYGRGAPAENAPTVSYDEAYTIAAWIYPTAPTGAIVTKDEDVFEPNGHGLHLRDGKVEYDYVTRWVDEGIRLQTEKTIGLNQWHHVVLTYDGSRWASGVKIYVDGEEQKVKIFIDDLNSEGGPRRDPLRIGAGGGPENRFQGSIDEVRIYRRAVSAAEAAVLADLTPVTETATLAEDKRAPAQVDKIRDYFLEHALPANIRDARTQLMEAQERRDTYYRSLPTVMVMEEMPTPRESHLLIRGLYDKPGEKVTPMLPAALVSSPTAYPPNRLGLARWLVDLANPLMARVTVNRFWQMYFGVGIVKTAEDFGSQGEAPSHPEVLDWLATEFVRTGWNVKGLQKTIVMSATYRQASRIPPDMLAKDPENRLLARGPNVRLSAEIVRDQALALAGLLVEKVGGPSVKPYQPEGLWKEVGGGTAYVQDHGDKLYRRSMYIFWRRTIPPPTMANFDASSREAHVVRPVVTNTPLQALNLMNDVAYLEAARVFAQRVMKDGGTNSLERIAYAFRLATARQPKPAESSILADAFFQNLEVFKTKPEAALKYVSHGEYPRDPQLDVAELAAYTSVTSLILNLSETVMKE